MIEQGDPIRDSIIEQEKQMHFLLDLVESAEEVIELQKEFGNMHIAVFGLGGVGSWIVKQLIHLEFKNFTLIEHDVFAESDITRNAFYDTNSEGENKAKWICQHISKYHPKVSANPIGIALNTEVELSSLLPQETSLIINVADEPYIGYTSIKLSRYCISKNLPLLVAGGFDAHLASLGELIIPGVTPCADCYAAYFKNALVDWNPIQHPVAERILGFGGLCSLSVFAASSAVMKILRYFIFKGKILASGRGELLFDRYVLDTFDVQRNPSCPYCSKV